jgi:hypothetical protein
MAAGERRLMNKKLATSPGPRTAKTSTHRVRRAADEQPVTTPARHLPGYNPTEKEHPMPTNPPQPEQPTPTRDEGGTVRIPLDEV